MMRLDKFVATTLSVTRSQAKKVISGKQINVNSGNVADPKYKVSSDDVVMFGEEILVLMSKRYFALFKPADFICSTQDENYPSALNLLGKTQTKGLHFAGRLDVDTTGLVLISDDGQWTHTVTSPQKRCQKIYRLKAARKIDSIQIDSLMRGVKLKGDDKITNPAKVKQINEYEILLTIFEGRYHQVKRMIAAVGNHVELLHREQIGEIAVGNLEQGQWRELTCEEISSFD